MAHQAQVNPGNGRPAAPRAAVENFGEFMHDVVTLGELQTKLFLADLKDFKSGAITPLVLLGLAGVVALGAVPVVLMGIGWLLVDYDVLSPGWALLVSAAGGLVLAAVLGGLGWAWLRSQLSILSRSQVELDRNVTWIKSVLKHSGRTTRDPNVVIPQTK